MAFKAASYVTLRFVPDEYRRVLSAAEIGIPGIVYLCAVGLHQTLYLDTRLILQACKIGLLLGGGTLGVT